MSLSQLLVTRPRYWCYQGQTAAVSLLLPLSWGSMVHYLRVLAAERFIRACFKADYVADVMQLRASVAECTFSVYD